MVVWFNYGSSYDTSEISNRETQEDRHNCLVRRSQMYFNKQQNKHNAIKVTNSLFFTTASIIQATTETSVRKIRKTKKTTAGSTARLTQIPQ